MPVSLSLPAVTVAVSLPVEPAAVLTNREIRRLAFRRLAFGSGQRRPNQRPMHRPLVLLVTRRTGSLGFRLARLRDGVGNSASAAAATGRFLEKIDRLGDQLLVDDGRLGIGDGRTCNGSALRAGDE